MSTRRWSVGLTLALVAGWSGAQESADLPEGYGERWITPLPAWRFTAGRALEPGSAASATLERGAYLLVPATGLKSLEVLLEPSAEGSRLGPAERAQVYLCHQPNKDVQQTSARSPDARPNPSEPPRGSAMLAVQLPTQSEILPGGVTRLWADLGLRPGRGWFAIRAGEALTLSVRGLILTRPPESWERLERALRAARDPATPWPRVWRARETLPGGQVETFLAAQDVLLPWPPADDDALARRTRIAAFQIQSHQVRPPVEAHTRITSWPLPDGALRLRDDPRFGSVWGRRYAMLDAPWERTVEGPATLRVLVRATWSHRDSPPNSAVRFSVETDEVTQHLERLVRPDLRATAEVYDDEELQEQLAGRELFDLVLSGFSEARITVPPGSHTVRLISHTPHAWFAVEELHRTLDLHAEAPFATLPGPAELEGAHDPRRRALRAVADELRGRYTSALEAYAALDEELSAYRAARADAAALASATPAAPDSTSPSAPDSTSLATPNSATAAAHDSASLAAHDSSRSAGSFGALDPEARHRFGAWVVARRADLAARLGDAAPLSSATERLRAAVEADLDAPLDPWRGLALEHALRLWLEREIVPPPERWARKALDESTHLYPELYELVFRALAGLPEAGGRRLPIAPAAPRNTRDMRALLYQAQLSARRSATSRYARLPRTHHSASAARRFLYPILPSSDESAPDPRAESAWQLAQTGIRATALLARATPLTLEARSAEPISLLAANDGWRGGLSLELGGNPSGQLTHVSPWAPVELSLAQDGAGPTRGEAIRLEATGFNPAPWLLIRGRVRPRDTSEAWFVDPLTLDRLEPDGDGRERLEARLSPGDYPSALRVSLGVEVPYPWPDLDLPFRLEVEGHPTRELRLLYIRGERRIPEVLPGPVVRGEFVVPPHARAVRLVGPWDYPAYGSVEEQRFGQPPLLLPAGLGTIEVPPSGVQRALARTVDVGAHLDTLRALSERLGGSSRGVFDTDDALPQPAGQATPQFLALSLLERSLILLELDQLQRARRDLVRALALSPSSERLLQLRIHTALAALAYETDDVRRLRGHTRAALRGGGISVELCLLAAAASANRDKLLARSWLERAESLRGAAAPSDLELLLRRRYGLSVGDTPRDVYFARLIALERWGESRDLDQEALYAGLAREAESLRAAAAELTARGRRGRAAHLLRLAEGCVHARGDLGLGHWPPAHGALDPAARRWPLPGHAYDARPPEVWLEGGGDRWRTILLRGGDPSLLFRVQGPTTLRLTARPAHLRDARGRTRRHAAPVRYALRGLPDGPRTRTVLTSRPSLVVRPGEPVRAGAGPNAPELVCGSGDVWRIHVPAGRHRLAIDPAQGTAFFTLEEEIGRSAGPSPRDLAPRHPPPRPPRLLRADLGEALERSLERRVGELTAASTLDPALITQLADDLLYAGLSGSSAADDEHIVRALAVYAMLGDDPHPDSTHASRHFGLALGLTRVRNVDLAPLIRDYRRVRLVRGAHRDPSLAAAVFEPPGTESLIVEGSTTRWRFASAEPAALALEVAANVESPHPGDAAQVNVWLDGRLVHAGPLELGRRVVLPLSERTQRAIVRLASAPPHADAGMRVHARLLRRPPDDPHAAWERYSHVTIQRAYAADGREVALPLRGPALLELERWDEAILARREVNLWEPAAQTRPEVSYLPVVRRGITPRVQLPTSGYVRLLRREIDPEPLEFTREVLQDAEPEGRTRVARPLAPPGFGLPRPEPPDFLRPRMGDHEFVIEPFLVGTLRERAERRQADEELRADTLEVGVRLHHWHPIRYHAETHQRFTTYTRFALSSIAVDGQEPVAKAELRLRTAFTQEPGLSLILNTWGVHQHAGGGSQKAWQTNVRLRYAQPLVWRLQTIFEPEIGFWTSSVSRRREVRLRDDLFRDVASQYRANHRAWLRFTLRLRWTPYQNAYLEAIGQYKTNESLRPQDAERLVFGVRARWHHEWLFAQASYLHYHRFEDADRFRTDDEDHLLLDVGVETYVNSWAWVGVHAGARYVAQSSAVTATLSVVLRFSSPGTRHGPVDPLLSNFRRYQDSVYPWPR